MLKLDFFLSCFEYSSDSSFTSIFQELKPFLYWCFGRLNPLSFCINHIYLLLQISNVYFTNHGLSCFTGGFKKHVRFLFVLKKRCFSQTWDPFLGRASVWGWLCSGDEFLLPQGLGLCSGAWSTKGRCCSSFSGFSFIARFFISFFFLPRRIKVPLILLEIQEV